MLPELQQSDLVRLGDPFSLPKGITPEIRSESTLGHRADGDSYSIDLYGEISNRSYYMDGIVTPDEFSAALEAAGGRDVVIHANSIGGDSGAATTMVNRLEQYPGKKTLVVEGKLHSAATYFLLASDERYIGSSGTPTIKFHRPWYILMKRIQLGQEDEVIKAIRDTKKEGQQLLDDVVAQFVDYTGKTTKQVLSWHDNDRIFNRKEAIEAGLVSGLRTEIRSSDEDDPLMAEVEAEYARMIYHTTV